MIDAADQRFSSDRCQLDDLIAIVDAPVDVDEYPRAGRFEFGIPVYDSQTFRVATEDPDESIGVRAELATALLRGPGIVVISGAVAPDVVDRATTAFLAMIAEQRASGRDRRRPLRRARRQRPGLERDARSSPSPTLRRSSTTTPATPSASWPRRGSVPATRSPRRSTSSIRVDRHRRRTAITTSASSSDAVAAQYPAHVHRLSPMLTLQGAVAHCCMPVESGPTMYLPHSQRYELGYLAWRRDDFIEYFHDHHVQLPLEPGDGVFFNPAVFHARGTNRTD